MKKIKTFKFKDPIKPQEGMDLDAYLKLTIYDGRIDVESVGKIGLTDPVTQLQTFYDHFINESIYFKAAARIRMHKNWKEGDYTLRIDDYSVVFNTKENAEEAFTIIKDLRNKLT